MIRETMHAVAHRPEHEGLRKAFTERLRRWRQRPSNRTAFTISGGGSISFRVSEWGAGCA